jgi:signal transduction histidine kinase
VTIKRRVRIALSLMMLCPFFLMIAAVRLSLTSSSNAGRLGAFGHLSPFTDGERTFLSEFNRLVNESPESLADAKRLAVLDDTLGKGVRGSWMILRDGKELFRSQGNGTDGARTWRFPWRGRAKDGGTSAADFTWRFRFSDGSSGALLLFMNTRFRPSTYGGGIVPFFFLILIMLNGFLGWWVSSRVVGPLARLRDAARRVGEGDLEFKLVPARYDEIGQVTSAFETMRGKLRVSLERQLAEEASRKELIAHVSHDLRTPINLIRGYAEGIRDGVASTPEMRSRYLETILERAGELERLIETLFAFSRMDLEGVRPKMTAVPVVTFLESLRTSLSSVFPGVHIEIVPAIEADGGRDALHVLADAELTRRAVFNLVENAAKHGGKPEISMQWRIERKSGMAELAVSDDGRGAAMEDLPRLFEPFFRGDRARTRGGANAAEYRGGAGTGAGLGLSIVAKIMKAQGGSVRAGTGPDGGLEVTLSFREARWNAETDPDRRG